MKWTFSLVHLVGTALLVTTLAIANGAADQASATVRWEQTQSVSVRIGLTGHELQKESVEVQCFVQNVGPAAVKSTRAVQLERDTSLFLYFPEDFARRALPGDYTWGCEVEGRSVARGGFVFESASQVRLVD